VCLATREDAALAVRPAAKPNCTFIALPPLPPSVPPSRSLLDSCAWGALGSSLVQNDVRSWEAGCPSRRHGAAGCSRRNGSYEPHVEE
jgi:hypothetical protein